MTQKRTRVVGIVLVSCLGVILGVGLWCLTDKPVVSKESEAVSLCQSVFMDRFTYERERTTFSYSSPGDPSTHVDPIAAHLYHVTSRIRTNGPAGKREFRYSCIARERGNDNWWYDQFEQEEITAAPEQR